MKRRIAAASLLLSLSLSLAACSNQNASPFGGGGASPAGSDPSASAPLGAPSGAPGGAPSGAPGGGSNAPSAPALGGNQSKDDACQAFLQVSKDLAEKQGTDSPTDVAAVSKRISEMTAAYERVQVTNGEVKPVFDKFVSSLHSITDAIKKYPQGSQIQDMPEVQTALTEMLSATRELVSTCNFTDADFS